MTKSNRRVQHMLANHPPAAAVAPSRPPVSARRPMTSPPAPRQRSLFVKLHDVQATAAPQDLFSGRTSPRRESVRAGGGGGGGGGAVAGSEAAGGKRPSTARSPRPPSPVRFGDDRRVHSARRPPASVAVRGGTSAGGPAATDSPTSGTRRRAGKSGRKQRQGRPRTAHPREGVEDAIARRSQRRMAALVDKYQDVEPVPTFTFCDTGAVGSHSSPRGSSRAAAARKHIEAARQTAAAAAGTSAAAAAAAAAISVEDGAHGSVRHLVCVKGRGGVVLAPIVCFVS